MARRSGDGKKGERDAGRGSRQDRVGFAGGMGGKKQRPPLYWSVSSTDRSRASAISYDALRLLSNERRSKHSCGSAAVMGSDSPGASCCGRGGSCSLPKPRAAATEAGRGSSVSPRIFL